LRQENAGEFVDNRLMKGALLSIVMRQLVIRAMPSGGHTIDYPHQ